VAWLQVQVSRCTILIEDQPAAYAALKRAYPVLEEWGDTTLAELIIGCTQWGALTDAAGNIIGFLCFEAEQTGDEAHFFSVLTPYVQPGSSIVGRLDSGLSINWMFDGQIVTEIVGETSNTRRPGAG
jgi:hypothetical protein